MNLDISFLQFAIISNIGLLAYLAASHLFFLRQIQKLVDKVMSRSYPEYETANQKQIPVRIELPQEPPDDLRPLQEFRL